MKKVFLLVSIALFFGNAFSQATPSPATVSPAADLTGYGIKIEPDKRLLVVMAALDTAGLETPVSAASQSFREKLRADSRRISPDLRARLENFVKNYGAKRAAASPEELTAPFVSLAYALSQTPDLGDPLRAADLPDNLQEVLGFAPLVREFYRAAGLDAKLPEYARLYQAEADKLRPSAARMTTGLLDYLHTKPELIFVEKIKAEKPDPKNAKKKIQVVETRSGERRFYIVPELLATAGTVNFRNIGDDYYAVVPPGTNLSRSEVRRAYLQFVLDPLVLKTAKDIFPLGESIKKLLEARRQAGAQVSPDVFLAVSRSLVAAVDAREAEYQKVNLATADARRRIDSAPGVEAKKAISAELNRLKQTFADEAALQLSEAYEGGAVLSFYFAERLKGIEESGFDIASAFRDMILSLDAGKEADRLTQFAEARRRALAARAERRAGGISNAEVMARREQLAKNLESVEEAITAEGRKEAGKARNYTEIEARLKKLLDENPGESSVYYALGRVSSLSAETAFDEGLRDKRLEDAKLFYDNALRAADENTSPKLLQLSYVALGRIFAFYDETGNALKNFEAAIKIGESADKAAYAEALEGKNKLLKKQ